MLIQSMRNRLAGFAVCALIGCLTLRAQQPPGPDPLGEALFPPELVMSRQAAIGLSDAQKASLRSEMLKAQTRFTELQWQLQDAMEALVMLLKQSKQRPVAKTEASPGEGAITTPEQEVLH